MSATKKSLIYLSIYNILSMYKNRKCKTCGEQLVAKRTG